MKKSIGVGLMGAVSASDDSPAIQAESRVVKL
jgi:hypothetical protein